LNKKIDCFVVQVFVISKLPKTFLTQKKVYWQCGWQATSYFAKWRHLSKKNKKCLR